MAEGPSLPLVDSFQPGNATPFEEAFSEAVADWWQIPVEILDTVRDPMRTPAAVLPYLASELGLPLWLDRWPESRKRFVTARWIQLSRQRGVEPTFRELISFIDGRLVEFLAPPQGLFPRRRWTDEERQAWRKTFPEIRVYPFRNRHTTPPNLLVPGQPWFGTRTILRRSVADTFGGRRATYVPSPGAPEQPVQLRVDVGAGEFARGLFTVALPTRRPVLTLPAIVGRAFVPRRSSAAERVYRFGEGPSRPDLLPPGEPVALTPDRVASPHIRRGGFVVGHTLPMILRRSIAAEHVYDSVRIYDPSRQRLEGKTAGRGGWILGRSKLRQPAYTLRLTVDLSRRRPGGFVPGRALPMIPRAYDETRVREALAAVRAAKLGRDRVLVSTDLYRTLSTDDGVPLDGTHRVGDVVTSL